MGDRTSVCLWVMKDDGEKMGSHIEEIHGAADTFKTDQFMEFTIFEVNYGELGIDSWAESEGIPFSYRWDPGGDYGAGFLHLRFNEKGESIFIEFSDEELQFDPKKLYELLVKADAQEDLNEAYSILRSFLAPFTEKFIPLEWETQEHNKMIARTVNLISGP